ncbi:MAG TPA: hypothetical protein VF062_13535 [Candidatus Limnocylindrales bacterium]
MAHPAPRQPAGAGDQGAEYLGFAVPLRLLTTLTRFGTADNVTLAELKLEAFLPADDESAEALTRLARR